MNASESTSNATEMDIAATSNSAEVSDNRWPTTPIPSVGDQLRNGREGQGLTIAEVAGHLKLAVRQVEALENDMLQALPSPLFARGFLRNYARLVKLDPEPLIAQLNHGYREPQSSELIPENVNAPFPSNTPTTKKRLVWTTSGLILIAAIMIWASEHWQIQSKEIGKSNEANTTTGSMSTPNAAPSLTPNTVQTTIVPLTQDMTSLITPVPDAPSESNKAAVAATSNTTPASLALPAAKENKPATQINTLSTAVSMTPTPIAPANASAATITPGAPIISREISLTYQKLAWTEVRDKNGKIIFSETSPAGSHRIVKGEPPLSLTVGNARFVALVSDQKPVDMTPYIKGDVARILVE